MVFCKRQCALIHIEQIWTESVRTAEGRIMHEHVHDENRESRGNIRMIMVYRSARSTSG
jgi:CRISPR-associated exonuclease Cas4